MRLAIGFHVKSKRFLHAKYDRVSCREPRDAMDVKVGGVPGGAELALKMESNVHFTSRAVRRGHQ